MMGPLLQHVYIGAALPHIGGLLQKAFSENQSLNLGPVQKHEMSQLGLSVKVRNTFLS